MADIENDDIIRLGCVLKLDAIYDVVNTYHIQVDAGGPATFAAASLAFQDYVDDIYNYLTAQMANNVTDGYITVANVTQATVFGSIAFGTWTGGSNGAEHVAPGVAVLAYARTVKPRVQFRKYFGIFTEADMLDGAWTATVRTPCENALAYHIAQQTPRTGYTFTGVVWNYATQTLTKGISATTSSEPAYQRRRKRGRGS